MAARLTLISVPPGNDRRAPRFPGRDRLDLPFDSLPDTVRRRLAEADLLIHAPEIALGPGTAVRARAEAAESLAELDYGGWTNRVMADVASENPAAFDLWRTDMAAAPHGGESILNVRGRVGRWLASIDERSGPIVALSPALIVKIAVVAALDAPLPMLWRLDAAPWSGTELTWFGGRWAMRLG